ncbi:hypothetical protein GW17_00051226 [Ensete ventricosum]|nr:hypothetical protein GW17_00051226 [Ensete ventricosum]
MLPSCSVTSLPRPSSMTPTIFSDSGSDCASGPGPQPYPFLPRSIVARPSSGGIAPDDSRAADALATIQSCFNVDSTLTSHRLVKVRERFYIPLKYELHVPIPDQCPYDAFLSGFGLSTDALEMGVRFSLHPVIEACLECWQISPSYMASNSVRDMNETWLAEAGLSLAPREMFNLGKMKSGSDVGSRSIAPSTTDVSPSPAMEPRASMVEKCLRTEGDDNTKEEEQGGGFRATSRFEVPLHDYSFWELCEVVDHARTDRYFASIMSKLCEGEGEEPLMSWWSSFLRLARVWTKGPMAVEYLRGALLPMLAKAIIDRVHDAGRMARLQHERNTMLRAANKDLKFEAGQEEVVAPEHRAKELQDDVDKLRGELESSEHRHKDLEQEVDTMHTNLQGARDDWARLKDDVLSLTEVATLLETELKAEGPKAMAAYKASRGF